MESRKRSYEEKGKRKETQQEVCERLNRETERQQRLLDDDMCNRIMDDFEATVERGRNQGTITPTGVLVTATPDVSSDDEPETPPPPPKKKQKGYRLNVDKCFLTYPQCEASPESVLECLQKKKLPIESYIIAQEKHQVCPRSPLSHSSTTPFYTPPRQF